MNILILRNMKNNNILILNTWNYYKVCRAGLKSFKNSSISKILALFNIEFVFERYDLLNQPKFSRHIVKHGFFGYTYFGKRYYLNRKLILRDYRLDLHYQEFVKEIYNENLAPCFPVAILEASILEEGELEIRPAKKPITNTFNYQTSPLISRACMVPKQSGFFHFYVQVLPVILRNLKEINFCLDISEGELDILESLNINLTNNCDLNLQDIEYFECEQNGLYPSSKDVNTLSNYLAQYPPKNFVIQDFTSLATGI